MPIFSPINRQKLCRHGQMLFNYHDSFIGRSLDLYGEYCEAEAELFSQVVQPGQLVIEAGANQGAHTIVLAQLVGPTGAVIAFEPQRILFQTLCANLALNNVPNVVAYQHALGAEPGRLLVPTIDYTQDGNFGSLALGDYESGEPVPQVTLDSLELKFCHFIKIDVEGMEQQVIEGAVDLLRKYHPVLYVENDRPAKSDDLVRLLDSLGYQMYWHLARYFNPENFFGNTENVFFNMAAHNMLCIHESVEQNVQGFLRVEVPK